MTTSRFIARLVGPVLVVIGIGGLANLIYLAGVLGLIGGLAIVNVHNSWARGWPLIITVFGWLAIVGGTVRVLAPQVVEQVGAAIVNQAWFVMGFAILFLAIGGFLSFKGYSK